MGGDALKQCSTCKEHKPLAMFNKRKASEDGLQPLCRDCQQASNNKSNKDSNLNRMYVNNQYVSRKHPMWKPGRYTMLDASFFFMAQEEEKTTPDGYVYIITNPAWPECVKVGMAKSPDGRLGGFQTYSPYRDYTAYHMFYCKDYAKAERKAHKLMESKYQRAQGEWFICTPEDALKTLEGRLK